MSKTWHYKKPEKFWVGVSDVLNERPPWLVHASKSYVLSRSIDGAPQFRTHKKAIVRVAEMDDLQAIAHCAGKPESKIQDRFTRGEICFVTVVAGSIVGYEWLATAATFDEPGQGVSYVCDAKTAWLYDGFVLPEFRLKGLWLNLQYCILAYLQKTSKKRIACSIDFDNIGSIKTHLRFGFEVTHQVVSLTILGLAVRWVTYLRSDRTKIKIGWWRKNLQVEV